MDRCRHGVMQSVAGFEFHAVFVHFCRWEHRCENSTPSPVTAKHGGHDPRHAPRHEVLPDSSIIGVSTRGARALTLIVAMSWTLLVERPCFTEVM